MSEKAELLEAMRAARTDLEAVVAAANGDLGRRQEGEATLADILAHIAVWERMAARKLTGAPLPVGDDVLAGKKWSLNAFNEASFALWRKRSHAEILAEFAAAHQALVAAVEAANDADCAPGGKVWKAVDEDSAGHYHWHFPIADAMVATWPVETKR